MSTSGENKNAGNGVEHAQLLSFEETRTHLSSGYENTQRVVQFMDTKAAAVVGLCLGIFYVIGQASFALHERLGEGMLSPSNPQFQPLLWVFAGLVFSSGVLGCLCLYFAFRTVRPNALPKPEHFSTLFPAVHEAWRDKHAIEHLTKFVGGDLRIFILNEYKQQLLAMGGLIYMKIKFARRAIIMVGWQGASTCALLLSIGLSFGFGWLKTKQEEPSKPNLVLKSVQGGPPP